MKMRKEKFMYQVSKKHIVQYREQMKKEEKSEATIEKYIRDLNKLLQFTDNYISKDLLIAYKKYLKDTKKYKISSINSFLAAANHFLKSMEWNECCVKSYRTQNSLFEPDCKNLTKEDYFQLIKTAQGEDNLRLSCLIQTIGATGIRISELRYVTVESVKQGIITIYSKGKYRKILIPSQLKELLLDFAQKNGYKNGVLFRTASGNPVNRSNIWKEMKKLAKKAGINEKKIFPHNFRHLFAKTFYEIDHDIAKLSDLLGHSSITTTQIYIRSSIDEHQRKLEKMHLIL